MTEGTDLTGTDISGTEITCCSTVLKQAAFSEDSKRSLQPARARVSLSSTHSDSKKTANTQSGRLVPLGWGIECSQALPLSVAAVTDTTAQHSNISKPE